MRSIPLTLESQADVAVKKVGQLSTPGRFLISGMLAGAYIGVGIVLMVSTAGPLYAAGDGFAKLVAGVVFGTALTLVVFAGADLATSSMMQLPQGVLMQRVRAGRATLALTSTFVFNLLGALAFSAIVAASGVVVANAPALSMLTSLLETKASLSPLELFTRGVLCNALVCLAIWMCDRVSSEIAKIALVFIAITAFISSGFEHVVANMTAYGIGLFLDVPGATWALFGQNLLWVGLGNLVGGGLIIGAGYWLIGGRPTAKTATAHDSSEKVAA